jgi:N utilization substance protein A
MASLLYQTIEQISREKHIEPEIIVAAIEDAMVVAARKYYRTEEDIRSKFNPESGQVDVFSVHTVVEEVTDPLREISLGDAKKRQPEIEVGGEVIESKPTDVLGRIAAQTAKQVILQKVREAERDTIYNEFHTRVGELINSVVKRMEGPDIVVDLGRTEARLPKREQSRLEAYNVGDRLRVTIRAVERAAKGPQVVVSRADPALVQRLFEMEVPEIYDGTVQIRAVAREAGERTKIAVESRDKDVDPVGACVGMKGMRVQSIIRELRGEKIDIIPYNEETIAFAQKALSPAKSHARAGGGSGRKKTGSDCRGHPAFARDRQERPERAAGQQIDRLEYRHQERGREAPGDRSADGGAYRSRNAAHRIGGRGSEDDRETRSCWNHLCREARGYDAGTAG